MITRLSSDMRAERRAAARLHLAELGSSDLAALGEEFLERFYYGALLEDPEYFCYLSTVDGAVAGFTAFSTDAQAVCRRGVARAWRALSWVLIKCIVRRPARLAALASLANGWLSMRREACADVKAEAMTTAVAGAFRTAEFYRARGINVAQELYVTVARTLWARGVKTVKGFTLTSNLRVTAALSSLGWRKVGEGIGLRPAVRQATCVWLWDLEQAAERFQFVKEGAPASRTQALAAR